MYPNVHNFSTLFISTGILGKILMFRAKNREYLRKKMKKIEKLGIFQLQFLRPEKGFRPPLKGWKPPQTWIFGRKNFFFKISKFEPSRSKKVQNFAKKRNFWGPQLCAKMCTYVFDISETNVKNVILCVGSKKNDFNTPPPNKSLCTEPIK